MKQFAVLANHFAISAKPITDLVGDGRGSKTRTGGFFMRKTLWFGATALHHWVTGAGLARISLPESRSWETDTKLARARRKENGLAIMKTRLVASTLVAAILCMVASRSATADVVFGNLGTSGTGAITNTNTDVGPTVNNYLAQGFTAASPNLNVTSIKLGLFGDGSIPTTVGIYADNFGQPAASALFTSAVTNVGAKGLYAFGFTGAQLTNGSSYWIIPQTDVSWYIAGSAPTAQNSSGYNFTQTLENGGTGWASAGSNRYSVSVQAVPEPSTYALAAVGLGLAGFIRSRRRRAAV